MSQTDYIKCVLEHFDMQQSAKSALIPSPIIFLVSVILPDIRFRGRRYEVGTVCIGSWLLDVHDGRDTTRHCSWRRSHQQIYAQPSRSHWNVVKHVFRYLVGTQDLGILFGSNKNSSIVDYTDSDFAGCVDSQKSTPGYSFKFGNGEIL